MVGVRLELICQLSLLVLSELLSLLLWLPMAAALSLQLQLCMLCTHPPASLLVSLCRMLAAESVPVIVVLSCLQLCMRCTHPQSLVLAALVLVLGAVVSGSVHSSPAVGSGQPELAVVGCARPCCWSCCCW